jgi:predicted dehydrogenase
MAHMTGTIDMVAFCDMEEARAREFSDTYTAGRAAVFTDHAATFERAALDMVVICLPPFGHSDEVEMAAERGIHVLIEKPIALTSELGWRMVEAAETAGIVTQVGFMYRFGRAVEELKTRMASGEAGPPGLMSARYFCNALHSPWWRDKAKSGGQVVEQVIHLFDLMRYLLGDPVSVYCRQENLFHRETPGYTVEDVSVTVARFDSGALGVIYATNGAIPGRWIHDYRVVAQRLTADFADSNHATFYLTAEDGVPTVQIASSADMYRLEMLDFVRAIQTGSATRTPIREGALSLDLVLAAQRSAEQGGEVALAPGGVMA